MREAKSNEWTTRNSRYSPGAAVLTTSIRDASGNQTSVGESDVKSGRLMQDSDTGHVKIKAEDEGPPEALSTGC